MWMLKAVVTVIVVVNIDSVDGTEICIKYSFLESSMRVVCSVLILSVSMKNQRKKTPQKT